jgi:hypothetical protein
MGGGPLGAESLPLEAEESAAGVGVELGVAEGSCAGADVVPVVVPDVVLDDVPEVDPLDGCVLCGCAV